MPGRNKIDPFSSPWKRVEIVWQATLLKKNRFKQHIENLENGGTLSFSDAMEISRTVDLDVLLAGADRLRKKMSGDYFDTCSIINARSGNCSEDCRFCAQSAVSRADIETYKLVEFDTLLKQGADNFTNGIKRFSLVTAGRQVTENILGKLGKMYLKLGEQTDLYFCASMGFLTEKKAAMLKSFGVKRYHCNVETARSYFPAICTTHTWEEKIETIKIARDAGLEICSGGIIGLGESEAQRLEMAFELAELKVRSIPINILAPIKNTPFEEVPPISVTEVLRTIALFRLINPTAVIRLAGGRNRFGDSQYRCFAAGANGAIVGNYLTTSGNDLRHDLNKFLEMGFHLSEKGEKDDGR